MSPIKDRFPSPLRYPGGKGKIANFLKLVFVTNKFVGLEYVEPYAGGASVALSLLYEDYASHIHINDLNRSVHAFWHCVLERPDELCALIEDTPVTMAEWHSQRLVQSQPDPDELKLAFSTFFMNRTNRSGIIEGGVIGGKDQGGEWSLDARYNRQDLMQRIKRVARFRSRITLTRLDAAQLLRERLASAPNRALVYLDPPYYVKGDGLYEDFYLHEHHEEIRTLVNQLSDPWVVSYDAAPQILTMYGAATSIRYSLSYSANGRYKGSEVMYFAPGLEVPDVDTPSCLDLERVHMAAQES